MDKIRQGGMVVAATLAVIFGYTAVQAEPDREQGPKIYKKLGRAAADLRMVATGLEAYYIDNNKYPVSTTDAEAMDGGGKLPVGVPGFQRLVQSGPHSLTTPIAYLSRIPSDPFAVESSPYAYITRGKSWLLWSPGPDGRHDMDWTAFDPEAEKQSPVFRAAYSYDVTNGITSRGDLWRAKHDFAGGMESVKKSPPVKGGFNSLLSAAAGVVKLEKPIGKAEKLSDTEEKMRTVATALATYYIDNNAYPLSTNDPAATSTSILITGDIAAIIPSDAVPTFANYSLTTPVAYLHQMPKDPHTSESAPFAYTYISHPNRWLLWSPGPDGEYEVNWTEFRMDTEWPSPEFLARYSYDPTNGAVSAGDVIRVGQ